jgi:hydroxylaminobenzene mutase
MNDSLDLLEGPRLDGHRLLQVGGVLFLLGLFAGLGVPKFAVPRLGLSTHLLGITQGTLLMVAGLLWPKLRLSRSASRVGCIVAIYGCLACVER